MNILFLEDQGGVVDYLIEELEEEGHAVFIAENIPKANFYYSKETIDCVVADLNMESDGLTEEQQKETHGGLLSGWVWLKYYVFDKDPSTRKRTILVTAYQDELKEILRRSRHEDELKGIRIVAKRRLGEPDTNTVLRYVKEIEKELMDGTNRNQSK